MIQECGDETSPVYYWVRGSVRAGASYNHSTGKVTTCFVTVLLEINESRESGVGGYRYDPAVHNLPPHYPTLHNLTLHNPAL
jgi:hypothetical protein